MENRSSRYMSEVFGSYSFGHSPSEMLRSILVGDGRNLKTEDSQLFAVDCSLIVGKLVKMKPLFNAFRSLAMFTDLMLAKEASGKGSIEGAVFNIEGCRHDLRIKMIDAQTGFINVFVLFGKIQSNFVRFKYKAGRYYWCIDTVWFKNFCERMSAEAVASGKAPVVQKSAPVVVQSVVPKALVHIPDVPAIMPVTTGKVWYWVLKNKYLSTDVNYPDGWSKIGNPIRDKSIAMELADNNGADVFATKKKYVSINEVIPTGVVYASVPF